MGTGDWNDGMNRVGQRRPRRVGLAGLVPVRRRRPLRADRRAARRARARGALARRRARLARRAAGRRLGRRLVPARLLRRRHAARLASQRRMPDRPDRAGLGGAVGRRRPRHGAPGDGRARPRSSSTATPAWSACSIRRSRMAEPSAGYIQAYPPGVRENGGQYSHAGVWARDGAGRARRRRCRLPLLHLPEPGAPLAPPGRAEAYRIEPYVMAGDIYSAPPYVGRGGWSWYTGSAAWMHRAAIESMFGVAPARRRARRPAVPAERMEPGRASPHARRQVVAPAVRPRQRCRAGGARRRGLGAPPRRRRNGPMVVARRRRAAPGRDGRCRRVATGGCGRVRQRGLRRLPAHVLHRFTRRSDPLAPAPSLESSPSIRDRIPAGSNRRTP